MSWMGNMSQLDSTAPATALLQPIRPQLHSSHLVWPPLISVTPIHIPLSARALKLSFFMCPTTVSSLPAILPLPLLTWFSLFPPTKSVPPMPRPRPHILFLPSINLIYNQMKKTFSCPPPKSICDTCCHVPYFQQGRMFIRISKQMTLLQQVQGAMGTTLLPSE